MALSMLQFQKAIAEFRMELARTREEVYEGVKKKLQKDQAAGRIAAGRRTLANYDGLLAQLDKTMRKMADQKCKRDVDQLREWVDELSEKPA